MDKKQRVLRIAIIAQAIMTFSLPNLRFLIIKFGGYWSTWSILLGLLFFIGLSVGTLLLIVRAIKYQLWRNKSNYFILATALVFICIYLLPFSIGDGSTFQSKLKIKAHYDVSMVGFRENGKFEIFSIGNWGYIYYSEGNYTQRDDSLFLNFTKMDFSHDDKYLLGDIIVIKDSILYKVQKDTLVSTHYRLTDGKPIKQKSLKTNEDFESIQ